MAIHTFGSKCLAFVLIAWALVAATPGALTLNGHHGPARVDVRLGVAPVPVTGTDGQVHLAYELHVTESSGLQDVTVEHLEVVEGATDNTLVVYGPSDLDDRTMRPDVTPTSRYGRLIPHGATAVIHVWISIPQGRIPQSLRHRLTFKAASAAEQSVELRTKVRNVAPVVLGPPLGTGLWLAHNGPGAHRAAHWGSVLAKSRGMTVPQRYAIDFIGLDAEGRAVRGDVQRSSNADWIGFGAQVLAAADGIVREARDGMADWPPLFQPPAPAGPGLQFAGGNYVVVEISGHRFLHYVHLEKGSVSVRPGQRVRRGELVGRLGNSGNTNGAHLHFNVLDAGSMEEGEGLPFVFDLVEARGATTADAALGAIPTISPSSRMSLRQVLPLNDAIISFR